MPFSLLRRSSQSITSFGMGRVFILSAALLWGTTGTAQALGPDRATPLGVGAVRMAVGGSTLFFVALIARRLPSPRAWIAPPVIVAGAAMAAYQPLFFGSVGRTGVAVGTIVAIGTAPILAGLLARLVRSEPLDPTWGLATALAIAGATLLVSGGPEMGVDPTGVALAVAAGASYAVYAVAAKNVVEDRSPTAAMSLVSGWAAVLLAPALVLGDLRWLSEPGGAGMALHLGVIATALAYLLFARGLAVTPVAPTATLSLAEPATATLLGVLVLDERLTPFSGLGVVLVAAGLVLLTRHRAAGT
jgi:DME family drug/metabolite transporter